MEAIRILELLAFILLISTALTLPIDDDSPKSARRRIVIYYNTDPPPALATRSSAVAAPIPDLSLNTNGTFRPIIPIQPNPIPSSLFTAQAQNLQQTLQARPIVTNQNFAISSAGIDYVPPTNVPPPSLVSSAPAKAVTAPLKESPFSVEMLPPLFVPSSGNFPGGWQIDSTTLSPFAVFIPRGLNPIK